jgi:hypothetical protein
MSVALTQFDLHAAVRSVPPGGHKHRLGTVHAG